MLSARDSFSAGCVLSSIIFVSLYLSMPVDTEKWRQCAPAQAGEQLVSSTQWEDHTDCFYQKMERIRRHTQPRKEVVL